MNIAMDLRLRTLDLFQTKMTHILQRCRLRDKQVFSLLVPYHWRFLVYAVSGTESLQVIVLQFQLPIILVLSCEARFRQPGRGSSVATDRLPIMLPVEQKGSSALLQ